MGGREAGPGTVLTRSGAGVRVSRLAAVGQSGKWQKCQACGTEVGLTLCSIGGFSKPHSAEGCRLASCFSFLRHIDWSVLEEDFQDPGGSRPLRKRLEELCTIGFGEESVVGS